MTEFSRKFLTNEHSSRQDVFFFFNQTVLRFLIKKNKKSCLPLLSIAMNKPYTEYVNVYNKDRVDKIIAPDKTQFSTKKH